MVEVKRKGEERFDVMLRRFNREVQLSGILTKAKINRYHLKPKNRSEIRKAAVRKSLINKLRRGY